MSHTPRTHYTIGPRARYACITPLQPARADGDFDEPNYPKAFDESDAATLGARAAAAGLEMRAVVGIVERLAEEEAATVEAAEWMPMATPLVVDGELRYPWLWTRACLRSWMEAARFFPNSAAWADGDRARLAASLAACGFEPSMGAWLRQAMGPFGMG